MTITKEMEMRFLIQQRLDKYRAAVRLGTWSGIRYQAIGPIFSNYDQAAAYIRGLKK